MFIEKSRMFAKKLSQEMKKLTTLLLLSVAFCFAASAQVVYTTVDSVRINNANGVPVDSGTVVGVVGVVYGPSFYPTHNGLAFMLKGQTLGVEVYSKDAYGFTYGTNLNDGDTVLVVGTSSTYHGQPEIELTYTSNIDTIIKLSAAPGPVDTPAVVSVIGNNDVAVLIQVNNVNMALASWPASPHAKHSFNVNCQSVYLYIDSFMSPDLWNLSGGPAAGIYNIVGFGNEYSSSYPYGGSSAYSLEPRSLADFHLVTTGLNTITDLTSVIYPNPASTKLTVSFSYDRSEPYTAYITDMTGRVVYSETGTTENGDNTMIFNTANYTNGMYILTLHAGDKSLVSKITIAH